MTGSDPDQQALEVLRGRITGIDAQMRHLLSERQALVDAYERHRFAIIGRMQSAAVPAPPDRHDCLVNRPARHEGGNRLEGDRSIPAPASANCGDRSPLHEGPNPANHRFDFRKFWHSRP